MAVKNNSSKRTKKQSNLRKGSATKTQKKKRQTPEERKRRRATNRIIFGVFLIFLSIYFVLSFSSYLFQWFKINNDDALLNVSFGDIFNFDQKVNNRGGRVGAALSYYFINQWFGISSYFIPFYFFVVGVFYTTKIKLLNLKKILKYSALSLVLLSIILGFIFFDDDKLSVLGGVFGHQANFFLQSILGYVGTGIFIFFVIISVLTIGFNIPFRWVNAEKFEEKRKQRQERKLEKIAEKERLEKELREIREKERLEKREEQLEKQQDEQEEGVENNSQEQAPKSNEIPLEVLPVSDAQKNKSNTDEITFTVEIPKEESEEEEKAEEGNQNQSNENTNKGHQGLDTLYDPRLDLPHYQFPSTDLLEDYSSNTNFQVEKQELEENKQQIVDTLANYSIKIVSIKATPGPTITLYEIVPAPGVRISKIKNLEDDIAMSLAALGIRIIAPIPGRGTIGIEVPNNNPQTVSMKSILNSKRFTHSKYQLPIGLGKTISNESYIADLAKMPHLLIAGATGQGKSVGLNSIIASLLYSKHPSELKFVLIDPKKVELTLFNKIERHYLAKLPDAEDAIITETREVVRVLNSLVIEMEDRYELLKDAQVRNIIEYNDKFINRRLNPEKGHRFMPYFVLVIDEFADLIMTAGKEIESPITRLAQLARAIGIHLIIATQRPSVNIITGSIKANFPARIAFRVISKIDSRTILDSGGADQLVGRGDMLLSTGKELVRLQGAFIDTPELDQLTEFIGSQRAYPEAYSLPEYYDENTETSKDLEDLGRDELFEDAARVVVSSQHGSTSLLQRKMKIGYNRAGRIVDQLEAAGIVGPFEGSKAREVLVKDMVDLEQLLLDISQNLNNE